MSSTDIVKADILPPDIAGVGLEDVDASDMSVPRLKIVHQEGKFQDSLSNEKFDEVEVVLLGLVKQRLMWDVEVEDDAKPLCKSTNFDSGNPGENFPWGASGLVQADFAGGLALPCENCKLKDWGSHPRNDSPWCSEQHVYPLLMKVDDVWAPSILTIQKTGIKPSRTYLSSFVRTKKPLFTKITKLSLDTNKRGSVVYSVPKFAAVGETEPGDWPEFAQQFLSLRSWLQNPPRRDDDDATVTPTSSSDDDDVTF